MQVNRRVSGFTLVEMILVIVITGIIAAIGAVFIAKPVQGYLDTARRVGLSDVADIALKRMGLDIRTAVPNTVRLRTNSATAATGCSAPASNTTCYLEFIPARTGGRYCADTDSGCTDTLSFGSSTKFDVLGPVHNASTTESIVIYNTGQAGLDAYNGGNRRAIAEGSETSTRAIKLASTLTYASPANRFQIVPSTGPVTFACENVTTGTNGGGTLKRYTGYGYNSTQASTGLGSGAMLADNVSDCLMTYNTVSARNGIVSILLTVTREGESVTLLHQIHVDNMP